MNQTKIFPTFCLNVLGCRLKTTRDASESKGLPLRTTSAMRLRTDRFANGPGMPNGIHCGRLTDGVSSTTFASQTDSRQGARS